MVGPDVGFKRSAAVQIGIVAGEADLIIPECGQARAQAIFVSDKTYDRDPCDLIIEGAGRRAGASDLDSGDGGADAESHMRGPAFLLPSILGARENLIETVGELHEVERVADAIPGPDGNAVART